MSRGETRRQPGRILDLFAGAGGWDEGLGALGREALGIETESSACATGRAAGHERLQQDVAELDPAEFAPVWGLIASPPCQAYSTAGKGLGRLDKPKVLACAYDLSNGKDTRPRRQRQCADPRSLLTIEPLRYALTLRPRWIALEQVPAVLELWNVFADLLRQVGYYAVAGMLSAERYGVPQTRKRAFLIASLEGPVSLPVPTHRSYSPRRRELPADEVALKPWVSMADALGWREPGGHRRADASGLSPRRAEQQKTAPRERWAWRNGNRPNSAVRSSHTPAPTIHFGHSYSRVAWVPDRLDSRQRGAKPRPICRPAPTMLASGLAKGVPVWSKSRPATTVACDPRVMAPGAKRNVQRPAAPGRSDEAVRVTVEQAAALQTFRVDYPWQGSKTRRFEQIGNAVPPLLARCVLREAMRPTSRATDGDRSRPRRLWVKPATVSPVRQRFSAALPLNYGLRGSVLMGS